MSIWVMGHESQQKIFVPIQDIDDMVVSKKMGTFVAKYWLGYRLTVAFNIVTFEYFS